MKKKIKKRRSQNLIAPISEDRILGLSNDLSENIKSGSVSEWRAVAYYFRQKLDAAINDINAIQPTIAAYVIAISIIGQTTPEMDAWLKRVKAK